MKLTPYLSFDGKCEAAFRFYEKALGGNIIAMHAFAGTPAAEHVPKEKHNQIMHAAIVVGDALLMGSDAPGQNTEMKGMTVALSLEDAAKGKQLFDALSEGGQVQMPYDKTFWAEGFGMLVDKFGTPWMVNAGPNS